MNNLRTVFEESAQERGYDITIDNKAPCYGYESVLADVAWEFYRAAYTHALEQAAQICDSVNNCDNPMTATDCADAIRALKESING